MTQLEHRQQVVIEARSWIGTRYELGQRVKGAGVDCALFLLAVFQACGIIPLDEPGHRQKSDWFCHTTDERYAFRALRYAHKTIEAVCGHGVAARPGCPVLVKAARSKLYNHGGIVTQWPYVVHAGVEKVEEVNALAHPLWAFKQIMILDPWEDK